MRLLNIDTLKLHEFNETDILCYAILSHTWGKEEVSFQDLVEPCPQNNPKFAKLLGCCNQARLDGWRYVWIDTCCIDRTSSAELSEAINSMYRWYAKAQVCYTHMSDVDAKATTYPTLLTNFKNSRWFTRGWTLQELLAPQDIIFFDQDWQEIGTRMNLEFEISQATGIETKYIRWPEGASVAAKMSWASGRGTTRTEDLAYCLLGLFDVNMPLIYGEGKKAFMRLQHEILKATNDDSIFAWSDDSLIASGLFAQGPYSFTNSKHIASNHTSKTGKEWTTTPRGTSTDAILQDVSAADIKDISETHAIADVMERLRSRPEEANVVSPLPYTVQLKTMTLDCAEGMVSSSHVMLYLLEVSSHPSQLVRVLCDTLRIKKEGQSKDEAKSADIASVCIRQIYIPKALVLNWQCQYFKIRAADYSAPISLLGSPIQERGRGLKFEWVTARNPMQYLRSMNSPFRPSKNNRSAVMADPLQDKILVFDQSQSDDFAFQTEQGESFVLILWVRNQQPRVKVIIPEKGEKVEQVTKRHHINGHEEQDRANFIGVQLMNACSDSSPNDLQESNELVVSLRKHGHNVNELTLSYNLVEIAVRPKLTSRNMVMREEDEEQ